MNNTYIAIFCNTNFQVPWLFQVGYYLNIKVDLQNKPMKDCHLFWDSQTSSLHVFWLKDLNDEYASTLQWLVWKNPKGLLHGTLGPIWHPLEGLGNEAFHQGILSCRGNSPIQKKTLRQQRKPRSAHSMYNDIFKKCRYNSKNRKSLYYHIYINVDTVYIISNMDIYHNT